MPLPLRYQWDISNSNCTYEHWLECELMKRLEIEETKILQTHNSAMVPCKNYMQPYYCPIGNKHCPDEPCLVSAQHQ